MSYQNRIKSLEKKYSQTNVAKDEALSKATIKRINKNYYDNQRRRRVDGMLNEVRNRDTIKEEVHDIVWNVELKELCYNCSEELILAVIILYVQKSRNSDYRVERTNLWKKYGLTWRKYGLIMERLLRWTREQQTMIKNDKLVDNEDFIWWGNR